MLTTQNYQNKHTPNIDSLLEWYDGIAIINDKLMLKDYGITDMMSMRDFYLQ